MKDLFGEWILIMARGALGSKRGGMRSTLVPSYEAGLERIGEIDKRRKRHGYRAYGRHEIGSVRLEGEGIRRIRNGHG